VRTVRNTVSSSPTYISPIKSSPLSIYIYKSLIYINKKGDDWGDDRGDEGGHEGGDVSLLEALT
jgi:hypothetical protein